ncbi:hypothetical protein [Sanguibacter suaedae]|uniref:Uncharacterized protein n=1 Tax=Sanguibacter suaedae TaxID=2795737 RepID=A0A934M776_9MICO|nr:hypothetical protein [Sanguibacter suaedae]MBI9115077.1 hypothetical protein [Sanguibacter suaedae]
MNDQSFGSIDPYLRYQLASREHEERVLAAQRRREQSRPDVPPRVARRRPPRFLRRRA